MTYYCEDDFHQHSIYFGNQIFNMTHKITKKLQDILINSTSDIEGVIVFDVAKFYDDWFNNCGSGYTIFFKQNLDITNLQYAELYPLIRQYTQSKTSDTKDQPIHDVMFHSSEDFKKAVEQLVYSYINGRNINRPLDWSIFFEAYGSLLSLGMVLDQRYGSCSLLVPPCLSLQMNRLCSQSGYIDSCGIQIYVQHMEKASSTALKESVKSYISNRAEKINTKKFPKKIGVAVWSHELFSDNYGILDKLKLHGNKTRISNVKISDVLTDLVKNNPESLVAGLSLTSDDERDDIDGYIWIMRDREIDFNYNSNISPGRKWSIIVYHQIFKNCNPLHIFDENKPAWIAPVTIPHSLLGAMINLTRPWNLAEISSVRLHDPFCGSGALILESFKDQAIDASGGDISAFSKLMLKHNLEYFGMSGDNLIDLERFLNEIGPCSVVFDKKFIRSEFFPTLDAAKRIIHGVIGKNISDKNILAMYKSLEVIRSLYGEQDFINNPHSYDFTPSFAERVDELDATSRLLFYVFLRVALGIMGGRGSDEEFSIVYKDQSTSLVNLLQRYMKWVTRVKINDERSYPRLSSEMIGSRHFVFCYYEIGLKPNIFNVKNSDAKILNSIIIASAISDVALGRVKDRSLHGIVTDPPYGFNTDEESHELTRLYGEFLRKWIPKIANNGHLVLCLPQETYNGQTLPYCTDPLLITSQVLAVAASCNRHVLRPAKSKSSNSIGSYPPYYWQSAKVLRRQILHFVFNDV